MVFDPLIRFFFGRDIFVSYSRRDPDRYVVALVDALMSGQPRPTCYLDKWAAPPDSDLPASLKRHLRWSGMLVLIATPNALASRSVTEELKRFPAGRKVLPINVAGALDAVDPTSRPWSSIAGASPEAESAEALASGEPSPGVIDRIRKGIDYTRQETRLQRAVYGTAAAVVILLLASVLIAQQVIAQANARVKRADAEAGRANAEAGRAKRLASEATRQESVARASAARFGQEAASAQDAARRASGEAAQALRKAADANRQTERQQQIARSFRLANLAQGIRSGPPQLLPRSVLLGVEGVRGLMKLGLHSREATDSLRRSVELLPQLALTIDHPEGEDVKVAVSPAGAMMATASGKLVRMWGCRNGAAQPVAIEGDGYVMAIAFDRRGRYLAISSDDRLVRVIDTSSGRDAFVIEHAGVAGDIGFSGDGDLLFTSGNGVVQLCRVPSGEIVSRFAAYVGGVVAFTDDGSRIANVGHLSGFNAWNTMTGAQVAHQEPIPDETLHSAASADGRYIVASNTTEVWWFDVTSGRIVSPIIDYRDQIAKKHGYIDGLAISPDGSVVATYFDGLLHMWEIADGKARLLEMTAIPWSIETQLAFNSDGTQLDVTTVADRSTTLYVLDVPNSAKGIRVAKPELRRLFIPGSANVVLSGDGGRMFVTANDNRFYGNNRVRVWTTDNLGRLPDVSPTSTSKMVYSADGALLAVSDETEIQIRSGASGAVIGKVGIPLSKVARMRFSADDQHLVTTSAEGIRVWSDLTGSEPRLTAKLDRAENGFHAIAVSARGTYLAVASQRNVEIFRNWTVEPEAIASFPSSVNAIAFSPDESLIAVAGDKEVGIFRTSDGRPVTTIPESHEVHDVAFSASGRYLAYAVGERARVMEGWSSPSPREIAAIENGAELWYVGFSVDERFLATSGEDRAATVWTLPAGQQEARFQYSDYVTAFAFSPDSSRFFRATYDGEAWVSLLSDAPLIGEACARVTRNLTKEEWEGNEVGREWQETCAGLALAADRVGGGDVDWHSWKKNEPAQLAAPAIARELEGMTDRFIHQLRDGTEFSRLVDEFYVSNAELRRRVANAMLTFHPSAFVNCDQTDRNRMFMALAPASLLERDASQAYPSFLGVKMTPPEIDEALKHAVADAENIEPFIAQTNARAAAYRKYVRQTALPGDVSVTVEHGSPMYGVGDDTPVYVVRRGTYEFRLIDEQGQRKILVAGTVPPAIEDDDD